MLRWSYRAVVGGLGNLVAAVSSDMIPGPALPSSSHSTSHTTSIQVVCALPPALDFMFVGAWLLCDYYTWPANNNNNNNNMFLPPLLFTMKVAQIPKFGNYNFGQLKI